MHAHPHRVGTILFLSLIVAPYHRVLAQAPPIRPISEAQGLPTTGIYRSAIDQNGHPWLMTDAGVYHYDGHQFERIGTGSQLDREAIVSVFSNPYDSSLWMASYGCRLFRSEHGAVEPFALTWTDGSPGNECKIRSILFNEHGPVRLGFDDGHGSATVDIKGNVRPDERGSGLIVAVKGGQLFYHHDGGSERTFDVHAELLGRSFDVALPVKPEHKWRGNHKALHMAGGGLLVSEGNHMVLLRPDGSVVEKTLQRQVARMHQDPEGRIWVAENQVGLHVLDTALNDLDWHFPLLDGADLTDIVQDGNGALWISTLDRGLFVCPRPHWRETLLTQLATARINAIEAGPAGEIYVGTVDGRVIQLDSSGKASTGIRPPIVVDAGEVRGLRWWPHVNALAVGCAGANVLLTQAGVQRLPGPGYTGFAFDLLPMPDGSYLSLNINGIHHVASDGRLLSSRARGIRCYKALPRDDGSVLVASAEGLLNWAPDTLLRSEGATGLSGVALVDLVSWQGRTWLASQGAGLWSVAGTTWEQLGGGAADATHIASLAVGKDGALWAAGRNGLLRIEAGPDGFAVSVMDAASGLSSARVRRVATNEHGVWLVTDRSLMRLPNTPGIGVTKDPQLQLLPLRQAPSPPTDGVLNREHGGAVVIMHAPFPFMGAGQRYRYRLGTGNGPWSISNIPRLSFPSLGPGDYQLAVQALGPDGVWGKEALLRWKVLPEFWQRPWFLVLCVAAISAAVSLLFLRIIRRMRRMRTMEMRVEAYHQEVLLNQMDPHFIFNALNSIQAFVVRNDSQSSTRYLATFSGHMRNQLEASYKRFVTLEEEARLLNDYCALENLRASPRFEWSVMIGDGLEPSKVLLPSLLVQPYVENAIRHGLFNLDGARAGRLDISFRASGGEVLCVVEDNGVGRSAGRKDADLSQRRPSRGLEITKSRLALLNKRIGQHSFTSTVVDLVAGSGSAVGTRVEIRFPFGLQVAHLTTEQVEA